MMPKAFVPFSRHPHDGVPSTLTLQWVQENPWITASNKVWQAAVTCLDDLIEEMPGSPQQHLLQRVITRMRARYPDVVPDYGFLCVPASHWIAAMPENDAHVTELVAARPCLRRMPDDRRPPGYYSDLLWFLPFTSMSAIPEHLLAHRVAALDRGGAVCLAGGTKTVVDATTAQILVMAGGSTKTVN